MRFGFELVLYLDFTLRRGLYWQDCETIKAALLGAGITTTTETTRESATWEADMLVDPGLFRVADEIVRTSTKGTGSLQVVQLNVQQEGQ